ncbi:phosphoribosyltransferase [Nonomuraea angiospora]|uniref:phosphoribosyltransferase n=1 Tax=Nonomuraea angiospora TaxID=46172 RepID=UPI00344E767F
MPISLAVQDGDDNGLFKIVVSKSNAAPGWMTPRTLMAATLSRFYEAHEACLTGLAGGPFTLVTSIPTTRRNQPVEAFHPLTAVINDVSALKDLHKPQLLLANDEYAPRLYDRYSHPDAFHIMGAQKEDQALRGERVLLVDDWFISGAHVQSAASKLFEHGAEEVVALVIIRVIDPSPSRPNRMAIWQEASAEPFDFTRCCICDQPARARNSSNL